MFPQNLPTNLSRRKQSPNQTSRVKDLVLLLQRSCEEILQLDLPILTVRILQPKSFFSPKIMRIPICTFTRCYSPCSTVFTRGGYVAQQDDGRILTTSSRSKKHSFLPISQLQQDSKHNKAPGSFGPPKELPQSTMQSTESNSLLAKTDAFADTAQSVKFWVLCGFWERSLVASVARKALLRSFWLHGVRVFFTAESCLHPPHSFWDPQHEVTVSHCPQARENSTEELQLLPWTTLEESSSFYFYTEF